MDKENAMSVLQRFEGVYPTSERITVTLREIILYGYIQPNEKITEEVIADLFKVSRTPVREALKRIENEGLTVTLPRVGMIVKQWSLQDFLDLYSVAAPLEGLASRLAAESNVSKTAAMRLRQFIAGYRTCMDKGDRAGAELCNFDFHMEIARCSNNAYLVDTLDRLTSKIRVIRPHFYPATAGDSNWVVENHTEILEAILEGDAALAEARGRTHLEKSSEYLLKLFANADQRSAEGSAP